MQGHGGCGFKAISKVYAILAVIKFMRRWTTGKEGPSLSLTIGERADLASVVGRTVSPDPVRVRAIGSNWGESASTCAEEPE